MPQCPPPYASGFAMDVNMQRISMHFLGQDFPTEQIKILSVLFDKKSPVL